jgi:hypothetical protein
MWEAITVIVVTIAFGVVAWALVHLMKKAQAEDRTHSDKDSGWYNDAG